jgi:hypothetical protein
VARHQQANKQNLSGDQVDAYARLGAYWGIDTDPSKVTPAGSLPCSTATVHTLASLPTRLSDLGNAVKATYQLGIRDLRPLRPRLL